MDHAHSRDNIRFFLFPSSSLFANRITRSLFDGCRLLLHFFFSMLFLLSQKLMDCFAWRDISRQRRMAETGEVDILYGSSSSYYSYFFFACRSAFRGRLKSRCYIDAGGRQWFYRGQHLVVVENRRALGVPMVRRARRVGVIFIFPSRSVGGE